MHSVSAQFFYQTRLPRKPGERAGQIDPALRDGACGEQAGQFDCFSKAIIALLFLLIIVYFIEFVVNINTMTIIENLHKKNGHPSFICNSS